MREKKRKKKAKPSTRTFFAKCLSPFLSFVSLLPEEKNDGPRFALARSKDKRGYLWLGEEV